MQYEIQLTTRSESAFLGDIEIAFKAILSSLLSCGKLQHESARKVYLLHAVKLILLEYCPLYPETRQLHIHLSESSVLSVLTTWIEADQVEISCLVLSILKWACFTSAEGLNIVLDSFEMIDKVKEADGTFSRLAKLLVETKCSILIFSICDFVSSIIASCVKH